MTKKEFEKLLKEYGPAEIAKNFVFPVKSNAKKKKDADKALSAIIATRRASISPELKLKTALMQLRFQIEDYLQHPAYDKNKTFGYFLRFYISILNKKRKDFAEEINIKPTELSQYINNHRPPPQNIIIRLELHSDNTIPAVNWYRLLEKKNLHELSSNTAIRKLQRRFVKKSESRMATD